MMGVEKWDRVVISPHSLPQGKCQCCGGEKSGGADFRSFRFSFWGLRQYSHVPHGRMILFSGTTGNVERNMPHVYHDVCLGIFIYIYIYIQWIPAICLIGQVTLIGLWVNNV